MSKSEIQASCEVILRRLDDYIDRELSPADLRTVERHTADCLRCAERYRFEISLMQQVRTHLRRLRLPDDLLAGIERRLQAERAGGVHR